MKIEWNRDLDRQPPMTFSFAGGPKREFPYRGRCQRCWGSLLVRADSADGVTGIRCRVCGLLLGGAPAGEEYARMLNELSFNLMNLHSGFNLEYSEAQFLFKLFPPVDRARKQEVSARVAASMSRPRRDRRGRLLTRREFPLGYPGMLFLQADLLVQGLSPLMGPPGPVVDFSPVSFNDDRSMNVHLSLEDVVDDPYHEETGLRTHMGSTMVKSLISAFACELAMKAISLTSRDEAIGTHDLLDLFDDLPTVSRERATLDYPGIRTVLEQYRQTFGKWRYFEAAAGEDGVVSMIDTNRSWDLGKAARVLLDEALLTGLSGGVEVNATRRGRTEGGRTFYDDRVGVRVRFAEIPPATRSCGGPRQLPHRADRLRLQRQHRRYGNHKRLPGRRAQSRGKQRGLRHGWRHNLLN